MDWNVIIQNIGSVGFPIVACIVMFNYLEKERESHKEEIKSVTEALNQNTKVITELKAIIERLTERNMHE
jgi:preprotein translocase subunit YajC